MAGVSMWRYPPTVDVKQVLANAVSPGHYVQNVVAAYSEDSTDPEKTKGRKWLEHSAESNSRQDQVKAALTKASVYQKLIWV